MLGCIGIGLQKVFWNENIYYLIKLLHSILKYRDVALYFLCMEPERRKSIERQWIEWKSKWKEAHNGMLYFVSRRC